MRQKKRSSESPGVGADLRQHLNSCAADAVARGTARLSEILRHANPAELFVATASWLMFGEPGDGSEAQHGTVPVKIERLAWELVPRFSFAPVSPLPPAPLTSLQPGDVLICSQALDEFLDGGFVEGMTQSPSDQEPAVAHLAREAEVVRGEAYPHQTDRRIREVQGKFDSWYARSVGIAPSRALDAIQAVIDHEEAAFNAKVLPSALAAAEEFEARWRSDRPTPPCPRNGEISAWYEEVRSSESARDLGFRSAFGQAAYEFVPCPKPPISPALTDTEWAGLLSLIGMTPERREAMRRPLDVRARPLYVLPDQRVLIVHGSSVLDSLWAAFDHAAREDASFYSRRYQRHAAKWLEDRTVELLGQLTGADVYRSLTYPDPSKPGGTAELDAAVSWGPFLLLVEAKAKQFRIAGQIGDVGRLRTDLKANIEEAFAQTRRAWTYVDGHESAVLKERDTGRELVIERKRIRRVYLMTVSLHTLGSLTTRLAALRPLGLFGADEYPFAISEADLEVLAELSAGPEVFLHYIEKRLALHRIPAEVLADEVDLFDAYLGTRFANGQLWDGQNDVDLFCLSGYSARVDQYFEGRWRGLEPGPAPRLAIPDLVAAVLGYLRSRPGDDAKWIAFCLLDLPAGALGAIGEALATARQQPPQHGAFRRMVCADRDTVICVVVSRGRSRHDLARNLERRVTIERHRRRVRRAVGIGVAIEDDNPFTSTIWVDKPWQPDPELDKLVELDPYGVPSAGTELPGRNEPCICGSGRKYKKCCLQKIESARRQARPR